MQSCLNLILLEAGSRNLPVIEVFPPQIEGDAPGPGVAVDLVFNDRRKLYTFSA
jgi:hypothetical protein